MDNFFSDYVNKISEAFYSLQTVRRKGTALLTVTIAAAVIVGLTAFGYARLYNSGMSYFATNKSAAIAQSYLDSALDAARTQKYDDLEVLIKDRQPIGQTGYFETITVGQESQGTHGNLSRDVVVQIYFGDEQTPRVESSVERVNFSQLEGNLYDEPGDNQDGPINADSTYANFALKKDSVRFSGQQVGDLNRPVYMDSTGTVLPVDYFYRGNYNKTANKLLTYSGNFIDFINKEWISGNSAVAEEKVNEDSGYIRYRNGTVFAWAKGSSSQASGKHISVEKPFPFKTLQAYSSDSNFSNENSYNRLVWWIPGSSLTKDVFMLSSAVAGITDTFSVFWVGTYDAKDEWADITVTETEHQTIKVIVTDAITGEKTELYSGYSGVFPKGSTFTATIIPDDLYTPGKLNITNGVLNNTVNITASKPTVMVAPELWDYYVYCARGRSWDYIDGIGSENYGEPFGPKSYVYYIFETKKSGRYKLNCKIWACTGHNHSSSSEGNSYFNIAFKLGDVYLAGTDGDVNGFTAPLYGTCGCWSGMSNSSCKEMDFGASEPVYLKEGPHKVDLWVKLFQINNKHSAIRISRMEIIPTYIGE